MNEQTNSIEYLDEFDPHHNLYDFITWQVTKDAIGKDFVFPFSIVVFDRFGTELKKSKMTRSRTASRCTVNERIEGSFEPGEAIFPLTSKLTDASGNTCGYTMPTELMEQVMIRARVDDDGVAHFEFPADEALLKLSRRQMS